MSSLRNQELNGARLRVLMYLAWKHDHRSGRSWPSLETIAIETGIQERTVRRSIGNGKGHVSHYEFPALTEQLGLELDQVDQAPVDQAPAKGDTKGDTVTAKGDNPGHQRGTIQATKGDNPGPRNKEEKVFEKQNQKN